MKKLLFVIPILFSSCATQSDLINLGVAGVMFTAVTTMEDWAPEKISEQIKEKKIVSKLYLLTDNSSYAKDVANSLSHEEFHIHKHDYEENKMPIINKDTLIDKKVFVVISEGELYEGSTWEALLFAKHHELENLIIFIDINSLIILGSTNECLKLDPIENKIKGLGIECTKVDGHDINQISTALTKIENSKKLNCILANTIKGKGSSIMENKKNWHYWNQMSDDEIKKTRLELDN